VVATGLAVLVAVMCAACVGSPSRLAGRRATGALVARGRGPARSHVVLVVMENKEAGQVLGSPAAPYLNRLARRFGVAARSHGVAHPSLPNYITLVSGSTQGITSDCTACTAHAALAGQLEQAHRGWRAYLEPTKDVAARRAAAGSPRCSPVRTCAREPGRLGRSTTTASWRASRTPSGSVGWARRAMHATEAWRRCSPTQGCRA
jgi:hypothetical protein